MLEQLNECILGEVLLSVRRQSREQITTYLLGGNVLKARDNFGRQVDIMIKTSVQKAGVQGQHPWM